MAYGLRFLGVGSAHATELGSANAVLERDGAPLMMIDCGPEGLTAFEARYGALPRAIFVTHAHLDHIGGMERLFYRAYFDRALRGAIRIYAAAPLVPVLHERLGGYPSALAEGGANFWDAFQLVPCGRDFWHAGLAFDVFPVRHHAPNSAFGVALRGSFVWTGDTRPIPEQLAAFDSGERIAHDCGLKGNPSHTGLDDLEREYSLELRKRMVLYHYGSAADAAQMRDAGYAVADAGALLYLPEPARVPVEPV